MIDFRHTVVLPTVSNTIVSVGSAFYNAIASIGYAFVIYSVIGE